MGAKTKKTQFRRLIDEVGVPWSDAGTYEAFVGGVGKNDQWAVELGFVALDGALYCHSIRIKPDGVLFMKSTDELPGGGITSSVLSSIKLEEIFRSLRIGDRALRAAAPDGEPRPAPAGPRRGRPPLDDKHYRKVALTYLDALDKAPGHPITWMAKEFGNESSTVRGWVSEARKRGFLTSGVRGKAGALPGPRLTGGDIRWPEIFDVDPADEES